MNDSSTQDASIPRASVVPVATRSWAWLLPALALALAAFLMIQSVRSQGTSVFIHAREGHGVKAGDQVRFRGISVGSVQRLSLSADLVQVVLDVELIPEAEDIARVGSLFWIVRPHLSLDSVTGLETIVGARYLAVLPGPEGGARQTEFVAREEPPVAESVGHGGLELILEADATHGITPGAPLTYRQIAIGTVLSVGLSSDATCVEVRTHVFPGYTRLVRSNSRFWETGGLEFGLSLTAGLQVEMASLQSLLGGGIALATPDQPGESVSIGERFALHAEAQEDWLKWSPPLPVGAFLLPADVPVPRPMRATLTWEEGRLLRSDETSEGWVLPVADGLLGPQDLLGYPEDARDESVRLEVAGDGFPVPRDPAWAAAGVALLPITIEGAAVWESFRIRSLDAEPEGCLVFGDASSPPMALSPARLTATSRGWQVDPAIGLGLAWHGAVVLSREDGALIGVLLTRDGHPRIVPASTD